MIKKHIHFLKNLFKNRFPLHSLFVFVESDSGPPRLVIEMLPPDENLSLFERIVNSLPLVKRKSSDGSSSNASDSDDRRDSIKSAFSYSSIDLSNRRASSASTFGSRTQNKNYFSSYYQIGNHGTYGPVLSTTDRFLGIESKNEKCPLTRCLSAREARMIKKSKSVKQIDFTNYKRNQQSIS